MLSARSYFQTSGTLLLAVHNWTSVLENFPYGLGALMFNYMLYQSKLISRWLSVWGLIGATLHLAEGVLAMFGFPDISVLGVPVFLPIALQEMVYAVWLIVKGFNSSAIASESVKTDINEIK